MWIGSSWCSGRISAFDTQQGKREGISMTVKFPEKVAKFELEYALGRELDARQEAFRSG